MKRWYRRFMIILMFAFFVSLTSVAFAGDGCKAIYGNGSLRFMLATGSPGELGLLNVLAETFNKDHDTSMCWKKAGSGASLKLLKEKKADHNVVLFLNKKSYYHYHPLGPTLVITPWNYPFLIPMYDVLGALSSGNTVILRPSSSTALIGLLVGEILVVLLRRLEDLLHPLVPSGVDGDPMSDGRVEQLSELH